ncbi:MAG: hypothetical protein V3U27_20835, partial [Candidatus Tectomicrobia bacterium]
MRPFIRGARGMRLALALALIGGVVLHACSGDAGTASPVLPPPPPPPPPPPGTVTPAGGSFSFAGDHVTLVFPANAVSQDVTVRVEATSSFPASLLVVGGTVYDFGPDGLNFA